MDVVVFNNQYNLMYSMGRLQEFYENPKLKGVYFSRSDLQQWQHDYYVRWNGCNVPPDVVNEFRNVFQRRLDDHEELLLGELTDNKYVVGVHLGLGEKMVETIDHERAHAMYAMDDNYRVLARERVAQLDSEVYRKAREKLLSMGYHADVIDDEVQAYMVSGWEKLGLGDRLELGAQHGI